MNPCYLNCSKKCSIYDPFFIYIHLPFSQMKISLICKAGSTMKAFNGYPPLVKTKLHDFVKNPLQLNQDTI